MMFDLISSDDLKMPPVFIKSCQKGDTNEYIQTVENHVKAWIDAHYSLNDKVVSQQDGAPPHTSQKTQRWLQEDPPKHWSKEIWSPGSPDLSPLHYSIWAYMELRGCQCPHNSVNSLKAYTRRSGKDAQGLYPDHLFQVHELR